MSNPKRQHFLPKSALKTFAEKNEDKYFVEVGSVLTGEVKYPVSITDICVSKNLYTLPDVEDASKYVVEKMYAEQIDAVYPEVYQWLTDPNIDHITDEQRHKILNVVISLYFRNHRFLNDKNEEIDRD